MRTLTASIISRLVLTICLSFGLAALAAAADFEGSFAVSMVDAKGTTTDSTGVLKGGLAKIIPKTAIKIEGGVEGYPIMNFPAKKITVISPKDKYYLDMPMDQFTKAIDTQAVKIKASGKTDTILGHPVEEWVLDDPTASQEFSVWATKDFTIGVNLYLSLQKLYPVEGLTLGRMGKAIIAQGLLPLKAIVSDKTGAKLLDWQFTALTPKPIKDSEFAIPAGYGKMSDVLKKNRAGGNR